MDKNAKFGLLVGAGAMIGLGVGFFLLPNGLAFVGSIMLGIGAGLLAGVFVR
jgi:hypothetical protein